MSIGRRTQHTSFSLNVIVAFNTDCEIVLSPYARPKIRCRVKIISLGCDGAAPAFAAPARVLYLSVLPPTFVMNCEEVRLRDEDLDFTRRLIVAGVSVGLHHDRRSFHAFDVITPETAVARGALTELVRFLRDAAGPANRYR